MLSIGDWVDKLIIENIKIFNIREELLLHTKNDREYVDKYRLMMRLNKNRAKIANALDKKINDVLSGKEKNEFIERIRTYND
jgi:hypothetical protein